MRIEFQYYTQKGQWEPKGFMAVNLDKVLTSTKSNDHDVFPIANLKKIFKVLHELTNYDIQQEQEQKIACWLDQKAREIQAREHKPSDQLVEHLKHWQDIVDGKEETQMSMKAVRHCLDQAKKRLDEVRYSKEDAKLAKRLESMKKAFVETCNWKGEIA